ncbi:MAG: hypothetical protein PHR22_05165 [Candidatus Omnitrophica bacterium]|nr:hypothetical protein [Candidatus Omnitrophota bacterium]
MKKILVMLVVLCFAASASAAWWSRSETNKTENKQPAESTKTTEKNTAKQASTGPVIVSGKVTSTNPPQNEIVILDSKLKYNRVFTVDPDVYKTVNVGDMVEANVRANSKIIETIKVTEAAKKAETKPVQPAPKGKKR